MTGAAGTTPIPVGITSSANPVDAGLPFELTAHVPNPAGWYYLNWTDSEGGSSTGPTWRVDASVSGILTITLQVTDPWGDYGTANLAITVRPPPSVTLGSPLGQVDAGIPAPLSISVSGGVPPITAEWSPSGGGDNGSAAWSSDGNYSEEVTFASPGPAWVTARVADALGDPATTARLVTEVVPYGRLALTTNGSSGEVDWPLALVVTVEEGAPPFHWSFSSSLPALLPGGPFGAFPSDGTFSWGIQFTSPGLSLLNLTVIDALGAEMAATAGVSVQPSLSVNVTSPARDLATPFHFGAMVSGGLSPYSYQVRLSDGEGVEGALPMAGAFGGLFDPASGGNYSVEVRVTDALGQSWTTTESLHFDGTPTADPVTSATDLSVYGVVLAISLTALFAGRYMYRRWRPGAGAGTSLPRTALPTVRQIMKRQLTIDRETLLLLGEEAGESVEGVQSAVEALLRNGEVTSEPGPVDEEVLHWNDPRPPHDPGEAPR